jgi:hypothetical protein
MGKGTCAALLGAALASASCITPKLHPYELDDAHVGAPGVAKIGLLPLNVLIALPPELNDASGRVGSAIRAHVSASGREIVPFGLSEARGAWTELTAGAAGDGEPATAERIARYVKRLHAERPFDALVMPSLVYRDARIRYVTLDVAWDGVVRELTVTGYVHEHGSLYVMPEIRGKMAAVSLHLAVYAFDGALVFDSLGGLDLVHEVDMGTPRRQDLEKRPPLPVWQFRPMSVSLADPAALREGIALAFTPWLDPRGPVANPAP